MKQKADIFIKKLRSCVDLHQSDVDIIPKFLNIFREIEAGREISQLQGRDPKAYVLTDGWCYSYKILPDGRRQIIDFHIPGDFIGLWSNMMGSADHLCSAITDIHIGETSLHRVWDINRSSPRLASAIFLMAGRSEAMLIEHLVDVGRRSAIERTAHMLLELWDRLKIVGLASDKGFFCPLNQYLLADALGLSAIHLNRVLRSLRIAGLVSIRQHFVSLDDVPGLSQVANYDSSYLYQKSEFMPRF